MKHIKTFEKVWDPNKMIDIPEVTSKFKAGEFVINKKDNSFFILYISYVNRPSSSYRQES